MHPGGQEVSVLEAMLIVSPKIENLLRTLPMTPDMAGPLWMPVDIGSRKYVIIVWTWGLECVMHDASSEDY